MELKQKLADGFSRLGQDLDIVALIGGVATGWLAIIVTRLINGQHEWEWFGAAFGAAMASALLTKQRDRAHRLSQKEKD
jgi:hypothetical protein